MDSQDAIDPLSALPVEFQHGLDQLDQRRYFECHETLEVIWRREKGPVREVYQGVLQIAVGCYHLVERHNWVGAVNKLDAGVERLRKSKQFIRFSLEPLIGQAQAFSAHLKQIGRDRVTLYDESLLPKAPFISL